MMESSECPKISNTNDSLNIEYTLVAEVHKVLEDIAQMQLIAILQKADEQMKIQVLKEYY